MYFKTLAIIFGLILSIGISATIVKVNGAGASFPYPIYSKWFAEYEKTNKKVKFNYQVIGSGGGIRQLIKKTVDFGASDAPMKEKDQKKADWPIEHVPTVLGAVAIAYNAPGLKTGLKLDGETLANIFLGNITKWNHPALTKLNPNIQLPATDILIVRRADGSGTTAIFSDYLSKVSTEWKQKMGVGKTLRWQTGMGARGNDGITYMVKQTPGAIGYVELAYAITNKLNTVALKNQSGKYVQPSPQGVSASSKAMAKAIDPDFTKSITNAKGKDVYPISAFTFILLPQTKENAAKLKEVKKFLLWALSKERQESVKELHYAPLPHSLAKRMRAKLQ